MADELTKAIETAMYGLTTPDLLGPVSARLARAVRDFDPPLAPPSQVYVPVRADGPLIRDNGGDVIAKCFTPELAARLAHLINNDVT